MPRMVTPAGDNAVRTPKNFSFGLTRFTMTSDERSNPSIMAFAQLDQHAVACRRVQKCDAAAVRSRHRRFVDEAEALLLQACELRLDVRDPEADVVNPLAALVDEFRHRGVGREWFQQLDVRV